ncbi:actin-related protein C2B [Artemisia annua]|uniref:Actin-related protein C2B n=1 Tax=Artemisia annua TaxID=35608 RepID=A0A2U1Q6T6_ARTAN|nr:actin-related protein C2B [Artemisia annua]
MACFERASPALKQILLQLYSADKPLAVEHQLHEFGSLQYHVQSYVSEAYHAYLSISTPLLSTGSSISNALPHNVKETVRRICPQVIEIVEPPKEGYQLTLKLDFSKIPRKKDAEKIITEISSVQSLFNVTKSVPTKLIRQGSADLMKCPKRSLKMLHVTLADKPLAVEHQLHEFGSLQYHVQSYVSEAYHAYLSISTPLLSTGSSISNALPHNVKETVRRICPQVIEIVEPPKEGYQLTLKLNFSKIPRKKDAEKIITEISSVQSVILSSQLREILRDVNAHEISEETYKPIKLMYHPNEPFYIVKQPAKLTAIFPIRFKEESDVVIAKAFFQELVDSGSSGVCAKAPPCYWSPIPPPELRGEPLSDLSTNGGFVSFDIYSRHVEGKKLDKIVWNLLNFNALVKYHVKSTKGFVQRRMRSRLDSLVEALYQTSTPEDHHIEKVKGHRIVKKLMKFTRCTILVKRWNMTKKLKRIRSKLRIRGFKKFQRRWLKLPSFSSLCLGLEASHEFLSVLYISSPDAEKIITEISSVQSVILSSQLREILRDVNAHKISEGTYKPIKLVYHPNEPFYVVKQPAKLTIIFPIRFKEESDVVIAKAFFQPIPPPELREKPLSDLSTNGGLVSFGKKLDKTVRNLLNFNALVKYNVKSTKGFVQRRMRSRLENLIEDLYQTSTPEDHHIEKVKDAEKIITEISSVQSVILSSQLREILRDVNAHEISEGTYKPIKLMYHPNEPFYIVKQPAKLTAIFPIRFKEESDELVDVGSLGVCAKAPPCYWSPIPPPELRGEPLSDLSTNGGFLSFGKKLDKTVRNLLNFNALVKYHVKDEKPLRELGRGKKDVEYNTRPPY